MTGNRAVLRARKSKKKSKGPRLAYRIGEWAELTGVSRVTVWRLIRTGELKIIRFNKIPLVPRTEAIRLQLVDA